MDSAAWEASGAARRREKKPLRRPPPDLQYQFHADNKAIRGWRDACGENPQETVGIPEELVFQGHKFYDDVARQCGTFVFSTKKRDAAGFIVFGIWGEQPAATKTRKEIDGLVLEWHQPKKARRSSTFASLVSLNPSQHEKAEKAWKKEVKRQKYRMYPKPSSAFGAIGTFHWPVQEYRPDQVLGANYEALDPIRMECSCYVVHVPERSIFQIMGKAEDVQKGLLRLRKTCFQITARQIAPVRRYLLHLPEDSDVPKRIVLSQYERPLIASGGQSTAAMPGCSIHGEGEGTGEQITKTCNESRVRALILTTLPKLRYYRASMKLRIRLGTFLATTFKKAQNNTYTLADYEQMIAESQFTGEVTAELGNKEIEQNALRILQQADDLLVPQHALTHELVDVKPVYSVAFTFADEAGDLRLSMTWEEVEDEFSSKAAYEVISKKWSRLERDTGTASTIIDISLKDVSSGFAWHFDLHTAQAVEETRLPTLLVNFAYTVKINATAAKKDPFGQGFVMSRPPPEGRLKSMQQSIGYRFGIRGSAYTAELFRFQERGAGVYEPRWGLDVYSMDWDGMFTSNERLPIGERANWEDGINAWFPQDIGGSEDSENKIDGFMQMMEKLNKLGKLIAGAKDEDLIGGFTGMSVG